MYENYATCTCVVDISNIVIYIIKSIYLSRVIVNLLNRSQEAYDITLFHSFLTINQI